jgi:predicted alpha/beta-hydrolase family hydrolase
MPAEKFDFRNGDGHQPAALLDRPDGPVHAVALFAHCFTCGKDNKAARRIADGLKRYGIAVLRFDFTGLGASEGEFANTDLPPSDGAKGKLGIADLKEGDHAAEEAFG